MIFKTRNSIGKSFSTVHDFRIKNLIVSGCSFTYNNSEEHAVTWPYYLRDLGGFEQVLDCSLPGAGNHHIFQSLHWALENDCPDPADSLVVVMWTASDRDDVIFPRSMTNNYSFEFNYNKDVVSAITGGIDGHGSASHLFKQACLEKTPQSRAIENYLCVSALYHYLQNSKYRFVFFNCLQADLPSRTQHFDIKHYLPETLKNNYDSMITKTKTLYAWALENNSLIEDDFHPSPAGHLDWTKQTLLPKLKSIFG